ncbi:MAG: ATP-binding protein, partial [Armatimonadetes bacterium]|nr:ATP-binding protein [Armatimonadota bacterium]
MRANPGGQIAPKDVIGRDKLVVRIWQALDRQSVVLTAARRMGKTSIAKKMIAEAGETVLPVYHDLAKLRSPIEFVETIYHDIESFLTTRRKAAKRAHGLIAALSGSEVKGIKLPSVIAPHWKSLLQNLVEDLSEHRDELVIFFWDEMPMMLENIKQDHGEKSAMEVLDTLRSLRQMFPAMRMVYTGSIGLHHVVTSLKRSGYANAPTNDMKIIDVPPLAPVDAEHLASLLLEGESIQVADKQKVAATIARSTDNVPFYIQHVVDRLKEWEV